MEITHSGAKLDSSRNSSIFWGTLLAVEDRRTVLIEAEVFYVATTENDAWSGRLSAPKDENMSRTGGRMTADYRRWHQP